MDITIFGAGNMARGIATRGWRRPADPLLARPANADALARSFGAG